MKNYDDFEIIFVLIKRWKLFCASLAICLICGAFWTKYQINLVQTSFAKYEQRNAPKERNGALLKVSHTLPKKIIDDMSVYFMQSGKVNEFRNYIDAIEIDGKMWRIYFIYANPLDKNALLETLENHPILREVIASKKLDSPIAFLDSDLELEKTIRMQGRPINKHFVYLDKPRNAQITYAHEVTSTKIIASHASLNSYKIWIFMSICSVMIALFVTFSVESAKNIKAKLREI